MNERDKYFMQVAIDLAEKGVDYNYGGPFGAVVVKNDRIIAEGFNSVISKNDPTAHAEIIAIRNACEKLNSFQLTDCTIYTSCEPCPMCLGAIYWARPKKVFFAGTRNDAATFGFDDQFIYDEIEKEMDDRKIEFENISRNHTVPVFEKWIAKSNKTKY
jgi:tRNA(Arg) A34 adenosine deaminase TadA